MNLKKTKYCVFTVSLVALVLLAPIRTFASELTDRQKSYVMKYYQLALEESVGHNVPWQIVMAQGILESGTGTTPNALNNHNHHGLTDGKGGYRHFNSDQEGWEAYFEIIENTAVYTRNGVHEAVDPIDYLQAIQRAGYAEDPNYIEKITKIYEAIEQYRTEMGLLTTEEYADYLELEALNAWSVKEQKLIQAELLRLYQSITTNRIENGELQIGRSGIENVKAIYLDEATTLLGKNYSGDLAAVTSREILDVG